MARTHSISLKRHEKVLANVDLPGVPAGTPGKVLQMAGLTWIRYRVRFDNGVELGQLDGRHIVRPGDFVPPEERVDEEAAAAAETTEGGDAGAEAGGGDSARGVPAHLLERSQAARARRAG